MANHLSQKQKDFVKNYTSNGGRIKKAVIDAGYEIHNPGSASVIGLQNLRSKKVQTYMAGILDKSGVTEDKIAESLSKVISAGTGKRALRKASTKDALLALDMALKIKGGYAPTKVETKSQNLNLNLEAKNGEDLNVTLNNLMKDMRAFQRMKERTEALRKDRPEDIDKDGYL